MSILVCLKTGLNDSETTTIGRYNFINPNEPDLVLRGPSTYQMNFMKNTDNYSYVSVHSLPEKLHVYKLLYTTLDPNAIGDPVILLDQNSEDNITGTACSVILSTLLGGFFMTISEELVTDLLGISTYRDFENFTTGPQLSAEVLGMGDQKLTHRWTTFAGTQLDDSGLVTLLGLRVALAPSATFGSTEQMQLYKLVINPEEAGELAALVSIEAVTSDMPFEPHTLRLISFRDTKGKKCTRLLALGKCQPERHANNLNDNLLEVQQGRSVSSGLAQMGGVGIWYTDDIEGCTDWKLLYQPEIGDVEVPSEQGRDYAMQRPMNFDIGMDYDRTWQRILCAGIGEDATRPSLRGRETYVQP